MATIKQTFQPEQAEFLTALAFPQYLATQGTNFPVTGLAFDDAADETCFFKFKASDYGSGNVTLDIYWYADSASSGDVIFGAALAAITPNTDTQDIETKAFATANTVTDTHPGTTGQRLLQCAITISNLDSLAADDIVWVKFFRDADAGGDTLTGDAIVVLLQLSYSNA